MKGLTIEERQIQVEKIAGFSVEVLGRAKVTELRELARGVVVGCKSLRKDELLKKLVEVSEPVRATKLAEAQERLIKQVEVAANLQLALQQEPEMVELRKVRLAATAPDSPEVRADKVFEKIQSVIQSPVNMATMRESVRDLVLQEVALETGCYAPTSRKSNKTQIKVRLTERLKEREGTLVYTDLANLVGLFQQGLEVALRPEAIAISSEYKRSVSERNQNLTAVKGMALLEAARSVLERVHNGVVVPWQDVSVALALATGRRCCEVHGMGRFVSASDTGLIFSGQTKARHDVTVKDREFFIPSLINTELVLDGHRYLKSAGLMFDDTGSCNAKLATPLRRRLKSYWDSVAGCGLAYKDLRAIYGAIALRLHRPSNQSENAYLASILGHSIGDITTASSYQKYKIADID